MSEQVTKQDMQKNLDLRKLGNKALLLTGGACLLFALLGKGKAHALAGGLFALLATKHIYSRRKVL